STDLLAVQLLGIRHTGGSFAHDRSLLVRVFAVSQRFALRYGVRRINGVIRKLLSKPTGHCNVIRCGVLKRRGSQLAALRESKPALLNSLRNIAGTRASNDNSARWVVLRRSAHHRWAADINLFNAAIKVCAGSNRFTEWVQIDHDELESFNLQVFQLLQVVWLASI